MLANLATHRIDEIVVRMALRIAKENEDKGLIEKRPLEEHKDRFLNVVITGQSRNPKALAEKIAKDFWPVRHPKPFELHYLAEIERHPSYEKGKEWAKKLVEGPMRVHGDFTLTDQGAVMAVPHQPLNENMMDRLMNIMHRRHPILVDLDHDDHTLVGAFKVWLAGARDSINEKARRPIGEREFSRWMRFGLLPAFDLLFWARVAGEAFTDVFLAHTLWPDNKADREDFADITERFRKVTRPMVEEVFGWPFVAKLWAQVDFERALDELVQKDKRNKMEAKSIPESGKVVKHPSSGRRKNRPRK